MNPVAYFEIPVTDLHRAQQFYSSVFGYSFEIEQIDQNEMALFPFSDSCGGITGALALGEIYNPTKDGVLIYFNTKNIAETIKKATEAGATLLYPITQNEYGNVAEIEDSEGNRIGLLERK